jgi:hypothetical protein
MELIPLIIQELPDAAASEGYLSALQHLRTLLPSAQIEVDFHSISLLCTQRISSDVIVSIFLWKESAADRLPVRADR